MKRPGLSSPTYLIPSKNILSEELIKNTLCLNMSDVCDDILDGNVYIVDDKYLIFYVLNHVVDDETGADHKQVRTSCFGSVDAVCAVDSGTDSVSLSSCSSKL
ncbi:LEF-10 [Betabaculovirus altermyunipunctae]|uniref:LEF-10 n=1 Tax=Betabaculovirus altermyunipunctae TaxID=3051996 RepID=A0A1S5YE28_9BBAC|nr:LEF-10 [Betabaculovirus altermyunipunctae]AQQ80412.1 LEF-10 [Betabaculovirus altermyunipunctae]